VCDLACPTPIRRKCKLTPLRLSKQVIALATKDSGLGADVVMQSSGVATLVLALCGTPRMTYSDYESETHGLAQR
jgi:hypothetical protein